MVTEGQEAEAYIHMQVTQDDISLYGFSDQRSLDLFKKLIRVSSVGSKVALALLSAMPLEDVKKAIVFEDVAMLTRAKGVGKTAQKIVLELKDKLEDVHGGFPGENLPVDVLAEDDDNKSVAIDGLINLGYSRSEAMTALLGIKDEDLSVEEYIKLALKKM